MSEAIRGGLDRFKALVAAIQFEGDTLALDKALAEASLQLYDIRHLIDHEWAKARAIHSRAPHPTITRADLEALLGKDLP